MKTRSLEGTLGFYLQSRRRLGFALEMEGRLLENLVEYWYLTAVPELLALDSARLAKTLAHPKEVPHA